MADKPFGPTLTGGQSIADLLQRGQQLSITICHPVLKFYWKKILARSER